jgi:tetratricopeptide (TPR) repeat protein
MLVRLVCCVVLLSCTTFGAWAQEQISEEEIKLQESFLAATKERILGNFEKAAELFEAYLKSDRTNDVAAFELGKIYDELEQPEKAIQSFEKALKLNPTNEWYQKYLADVYQKMGLDQKAADIYEVLVKANPTNDYYYYKWAYFLVRSNKIKDALEVYNLLESQAGISEELIRRKHSLYIGLGENKKAANELRRLIDAFPEEVEYRYLLSSFYEQIGKRDKAMDVYREIIKIDPESPKAVMALAGEKAPKEGEAAYLASLVPVFEQIDVDIDIKMARIIPFIQEVANKGDQLLADEVLKLTAILEKVHPNEAKAFSASGDLYLYTNRVQEAIEKYKKTLDLDDTVYSVWEQLMYAHSELKQYKELAKVSEEAIDYFPNKASAYYLNGLANNEMGNPDEAVSVLEQALLMSSKDGYIQFQVLGNLGKAYHALGDGGQSNQSFDKALQLNAKAPELLGTYAVCLVDRAADLAKAEEMVENAVDILPNSPETTYARGWVFYKKKDFTKAKEWLDKSLQLGGSELPKVLEAYGDLLFQTETAERAIEYWTKALNKGSYSKLLKKKIADRKLYE